MEDIRCRICLNEGHDLHSIFTEQEDSSPYHKLQRLKLAEVTVPGPLFICSLCLEELDKCLKFIEKCEQSNRLIFFEYNQDKSLTREAFQNECLDEYSDSKNLDKSVEFVRDGHTSPGIKAAVSEHTVCKPCTLCGSKRSCVHKPPILYTCHICQKVFTKKFNYNIHIKRHLGLREWPCPTCGAPQVSSWLAKRHCQAGSRLYCPAPNCTRSYTSAHNLTVHVRSHTGDRPHKCSYCGKRFTSKTTLNDHTRIHTGVKPYMCSVCGAQFATNKLVAHLKTHSQSPRERRTRSTSIDRAQRVGTYACNHCSMSYSHKQSLNRHLRKRHANIQNLERHKDEFEVHNESVT